MKLNSTLPVKIHIIFFLLFFFKQCFDSYFLCTGQYACSTRFDFEKVTKYIYQSLLPTAHNKNFFSNLFFVFFLLQKKIFKQQPLFSISILYHTHTMYFNNNKNRCCPRKALDGR